MSEAKEAPKEEAKPSAPKGPMILALLNVVAILAAGGVFYYTRFLFKKPKITEQAERERIAAQAEAKAKTAAAIPGTISFDPLLVNIEGDRAALGSEDAPGRLRYVKMTFSLEVQDMGLKGTIDELRPIILDRLLATLGKKTFAELNTVQGRYILRTEILDMTNGLLSKETGRRETLVTNVYFQEFLVQ